MASLKKAHCEPFFSSRFSRSMWLGLGSLFLIAAYLQTLHLQPWFSWQSEVFAVIALVLLTVDAQKRNAVCEHATVQIPKMSQWFFVVIVVIAIQEGLGLVAFGGDALIRALYVFMCIVAIAVGFRWFQLHQPNSTFVVGTDPLRGLAIVLVLSALLSVFVALLQATQVNSVFDTWVLPPIGIRRPGANLGQPNHLATLILLGVASLILLHAIKILGSVVFALILILLLLGLAITESRTGLVSALAMTMWWWIKRQKIEFSGGNTPAILSWVVLIFAVWAWPSAITRFHEGYSDPMTITQGISTSAGTRLTIWPQLWTAVLERPWFGWGIGEVAKAHNAVLDRYPSSEPFTYSHNILLDVALGFGIGIALFVTIGLVWWFFTRLRSVQTLQAWYCASLVLVLAVHSLFEFPFAYAYFLVPCLIAAGYLEGQFRPAGFYQIPRAIVVAAFAVFVGLLVSVAFEYFKVEEDFRIARFEALHLGQTPEGYERPHLILLTQLEAMLEATRAVPSVNMSVEQITVLRNTALRFPWPAIQNRYALSLALNGETAEALRQLRVIRAMHGEQAYATIRNQWRENGETRYPQLKGLVLP